MLGRDIANVRNPRIAFAALDRRLWRRHPPARHDEFATFRVIADNWREIVGEDARQGRHVADIAAHRPREVADRLRAFGKAVEVAHASTLRACARTWRLAADHSCCNRMISLLA